MYKREKERIAFIIGIFLILIGLINVYFHYVTNSTIILLWFCDHIALLAGILILLRKRYWLNVAINLGLVPVLFWIADYVSQMFFNYRLFGVVDYMFQETNRAIFLLYHQHLFVVPLMILALWLLGGAVNSWKGSIGYAVVLLLSSFLTSSDYNINCVHKVCISIFPDNIIFILLQYVFIALAAVFSNWLLNKYLK